MEGNFECTLNSAAAVVDNDDKEGKRLVNNRIFEHIFAAREPIPYKNCDVGQLTKKCVRGPVFAWKPALAPPYLVPGISIPTPLINIRLRASREACLVFRRAACVVVLDL